MAEQEQKISEKVLSEIDERFVEEVSQANELLEWAIAEGKGEKIKAELVQQIKQSQALLSEPQRDLDKRAKFEQAYNELTQLVAPVTWRTLRATTNRLGRKTLIAPFLYFKNKKVSEALIWSRTLWIWTIILLILVLVGENLPVVLPRFRGQVEKE